MAGAPQRRDRGGGREPHREDPLGFNLWDRRAGEWRQTWVDRAGDVQDFVDGELRGGAMHFRTDPRPEDGETVERRLVFTPLGPDRVRQRSRRSTDGGATWSDEYDLVYERRK